MKPNCPLSNQSSLDRQNPTFFMEPCESTVTNGALYNQPRKHVRTQQPVCRTHTRDDPHSSAAQGVADHIDNCRTGFQSRPDTRLSQSNLAMVGVRHEPSRTAGLSLHSEHAQLPPQRVHRSTPHPARRDIHRCRSSHSQIQSSPKHDSLAVGHQLVRHHPRDWHNAEIPACSLNEDLRVPWCASCEEYLPTRFHLSIFGTSGSTTTTLGSSFSLNAASGWKLDSDAPDCTKTELRNFAEMPLTKRRCRYVATA